MNEYQEKLAALRLADVKYREALEVYRKTKKDWHGVIGCPAKARVLSEGLIGVWNAKRVLKNAWAACEKGGMEETIRKLKAARDEEARQVRRCAEQEREVVERLKVDFAAEAHAQRARQDRQIAERALQDAQNALIDARAKIKELEETTAPIHSKELPAQTYCDKIADINAAFRQDLNAAHARRNAALKAAEEVWTGSKDK